MVNRTHTNKITCTQTDSSRIGHTSPSSTAQEIYYHNVDVISLYAKKEIYKFSVI